MVLVPSSKNLISPITLRKPRIRPPTTIAGINGVKISANPAGNVEVSSYFS